MIDNFDESSENANLPRQPYWRMLPPDTGKIKKTDQVPMLLFPLFAIGFPHEIPEKSPRMNIV
jgi:hypothetical protein